MSAELNNTTYQCGNCKHVTQYPTTYGNGTIACPKCKSKHIAIKKPLVFKPEELK